MMWEKMVDPDKPLMTIYGVCALHTGQLRLQTLRTCNTCWFSTATMVTRTRFDVRL